MLLYKYKLWVFITAIPILLIGCGGGSNETGTDQVPIANSPAPIISNPLPISKPTLPTETEAIRFLTQASFGADQNSIQKVQELGYQAWLNQQFYLQSESHLNLTIDIAIQRELEGFPLQSDIVNPNRLWALQQAQESAWWHKAIFGKDQLRQRAAFALSELLVISVSDNDLRFHAEGIAHYYDLLTQHSLGDFRTLLSAISTNPSMGVFLTHQGNQKGDPDTGRTPDENFARELMQLFAIGLYRLNLDGSYQTDSNGLPIPVYSEQDVSNMARVLTGWTRKLEYTRQGLFLRSSGNTPGGYTEPMECIEQYHDSREKTLLGTTIPSGLSCQEDLETALDILFEHPNVGPYISRHLITRLITSNPSPAYIRRVASVFNQDDNRVRGNLKAVITAILLDPEARDSAFTQEPRFGILKSPVMVITNLLRAFDPVQPQGTYANISGEIMTPLRASSVFNFYPNDHQPTDDNFIREKLVAPESQIYNDTSLTTHYNYLNNTIKSREIRKKVYADKNHREPDNGLFNDAILNSWSNQVHIDLKYELNLIEKSLSGSIGGGFENIKNDEKRSEAIMLLIDHLNVKLAQGLLSNNEINILHDYLMNVRRWDPVESRAIYLIQEAVILYVLLPHFAIQK